MEKLGITLIIILFTVSTLTHANETVLEDQKQYPTNKYEQTNNEREIHKNKRKRREKTLNIRRQYIALMYSWITNKRR